MAKLSIIICVYNTKLEFLKQCLDSIFAETIFDREVVIVDDGSDVDYFKLLEEFPQTKYFKTKNQGTLKAREFGARNATGDYICYVDSDDTVSFGYHEAMMKIAIENDCDIAINDWAFHTERTRYVCLNDSLISGNISANSAEFLDSFFEKEGRQHSYYVLWNKIFRREILLFAFDEIARKQLDSLVFAEDLLICYFVYFYAKKIKNLHFGYYFYRVHGEQQVSVLKEEKLKNHIEQMATVFDVIENDLKNKNLFEKYCKNFYSWKQLLCAVQYADAKKFSGTALIGFLKEKYRDVPLSKLPKDYGDAYLKQKVLPTNIAGLDEKLKLVYNRKNEVFVFAKKNSYSKKMLQSLEAVFAKKIVFTNKKNAEIVFDDRVSRKQKILHNSFVYKVGMFLFPKGSKIRNKLKSKL